MAYCPYIYLTNKHKYSKFSYNRKCVLKFVLYRVGRHVKVHQICLSKICIVPGSRFAIVKYQCSRLISIFGILRPVQANWMLENAVDEYLHKIVAADNLFWLNNEVHNMRPDNFVRLYNERYPFMTKNNFIVRHLSWIKY